LLIFDGHPCQPARRLLFCQFLDKTTQPQYTKTRPRTATHLRRRGWGTEWL